MSAMHVADGRSTENDTKPMSSASQRVLKMDSGLRRNDDKARPDPSIQDQALAQLDESRSTDTPGYAPHRHSGEGRNPVQYVVRSTQKRLFVSFGRMLDWIPAFAGMTMRPFGEPRHFPRTAVRESGNDGCGSGNDGRYTGGNRSRAAKWLAPCLLLLLFSVNVHAQGTDLLHSVVARLSQHAAVRANFVQQRQNPALTQPQTSSGQLLFVTGHGMLWDVRQPYRQTLALTEARTLRIDADGRMQPVRSERGVSQISQMLQGMLAGRPDAVERQFEVKAEGSAQQWSLHFTPRQARVAQVLRGIQLDGGVFLQRIRIDMQDGTQTDIRMTDTRDAGPLSALEKQALGLP